MPEEPEDKPCKKHIFSYYHDGAWWNFVIEGYSQEDAQERVNKLPFAQYEGVLIKKIEVPLPAPLVRFLAPLIIRCMRLFGARHIDTREED